MGGGGVEAKRVSNRWKEFHKKYLSFFTSASVVQSSYNGLFHIILISLVGKAGCRYKTKKKKSGSSTPLSYLEGSLRKFSIVDMDPVGSESFWRIRSASRTCRPGSVSISTKFKAKLYFFPEIVNILSVHTIENYKTYDAGQKDVNWNLLIY